METPQQQVGRLIGALEELSREEERWLAEADYDQVLAVQERERPLVNKIAELMVGPGVARSLDVEVQRRAQRLLTAKRNQLTDLTDTAKIVGGKLRGVENARSSAQRLRPAYGKVKSSATRASFSAEG